MANHSDTPIVDRYIEAKVGERVHIDNLLADVPLVHFYQPEPNGPSFCDTPLSSFKCELAELPYYTRIE